MNTLKLNLGILGLILALGVTGAQAGIVPIELRCGSWKNPLGIDDPQPRLSWQVTATSPTERSQAETAYEIQVASSMGLLAGGAPDLWDSGKVVSAQPFNVPYAGQALVSKQQVFWRVKVWDAKGQPSEWSPAETWTMGLLKASDWQGGWLVGPPHPVAGQLKGCNWIWYPEANATPAVDAPVGTRYFRKWFSVRADSALTGATLLMAADNSYVAYVNDVAAASGADFATVVPTSLLTRLQPGTNLLAVEAYNSGDGPNPAGLLGALRLTYADGGQTNIQLDDTWLAADTLQTNWQARSFDDESSWEPALVLGKYGIGPWGRQVKLESPLPLFRREFAVKPGLQRAVIYICGLGQYELSANGVKVGNALLAPAWSKYNRTCFYDTLDLTPYLAQGRNVLGVMLGNGMYNVEPTANYTKFTGTFGPPKLRAEIYLHYADGTSEMIASDDEWLTAPGPITYSQVYGGEYFDARRLDTGWDKTGFDASAWTPAIVTSGPGGKLRGQSYGAPPIVATQILPPAQIRAFSSNSFVYDMGQNAAMIASLKTHGPAGSVIQIVPAELTNYDGTINRGSVGGGIACWQYTLAGRGEETWTGRFFYQGGRYLHVTLSPPSGSTQLPVLDSLTGVVIQSALTNVGDFSCASEVFNRTRTLTRWAQRNNLVSILTDCPTRERLGWLEQYNLHGPSLRYEFDCGQLFAKTMQDMADSQTRSGLVPDIAPEYSEFGGGFRDSPEWGSSVIIVPWQHYLFTGDDSLLSNYYQTMTNYFGYLQKQSTDNFLNYRNGLGDWYDIGPNAPGYSQDTPVPLTADAYYCQDAQILAQAAAVLGLTNDADRFSLLATNIGMAFNKTYYSDAKGYYATGSQTAQALPLYLGIVDPANQATVLSNLVANIASVGLTAGDIGHRYLLRALSDYGRPDVVYALHGGTAKPGYGYIISQGATALTEAWDANRDDSQDHFMLGHITEWFYHDLAGIQPDPAAPGFQHVLIKPAFIHDIPWARAVYDSARGVIGSAWSVTGDQATLNVTIPVGATGTIYLPLLANAGGNLSVKESGVSIWQNGAATPGAAPGVTYARVEGTGAQTVQVWKVGSGSYKFTWNLAL